PADRAGEDLHLDAAPGQLPGRLDHVDVEPAGVAGARLVERGGVHADRRDPPGGAPVTTLLAETGARRRLHVMTNRGESPPVPTLGLPHMRTLVLLRHGESEWTSKGLFTGWVDVGLSSTGAQEAANGGKLLARSGLKPSVVHTSVLTRAIQTAHLALEEAGLLWLPVKRSWRLNE